ncbi:MAG TPA: efflux RND transporter periplasmic adaptor subunit [Planctomycetota bacterium]|nr:efflux RND transporter periplasmic adaptor subunit [Planctomycetota bacterium]
MKKALIIAGILIVVVVLFAMLRSPTQARGDEWTTAAIDTGDIPVTITAAGTIEPLVTVQVGSQVSGKIREVFVEPDQLVKKGDKLAALDPELLDAEVKDRELTVKQARNSHATLAIEKENLYVREQRTKLSLQRAKIALERSQANGVLATKNLQRYQELLAISAASQADVEIRELEKQNSDRDVALQRVEAQQLELELAQIAADRKSLDAKLQQAELNVGQAEQALSKAVTNLSYTTIVSPMDGVVFERLVDPGQTIAASFQTPNLFKIISSLTLMKITAQIDEADVGKIRAGQNVTFEVDAFRGATFKGKVKALRLKSELRGNLTTYPVVIEAENPPADGFPLGRLRPGMTAYLTFEVEKRTGVTRVPLAALRFAPPPGTTVAPAKQLAAPPSKADPEKKAGESSEPEPPKGLPATVYAVGVNGGLKAIAVRLGENDGDHYELLAGELKVGEKLVTGRNGALVLPVPPTEGDAP